MPLIRREPGNLSWKPGAATQPDSLKQSARASPKQCQRNRLFGTNADTPGNLLALICGDHPEAKPLRQATVDPQESESEAS